jgi:hypothetical protein
MGVVRRTRIAAGDTRPGLHRAADSRDKRRLAPAGHPAPEALRAIGVAVYGFDRAVHHESWAQTPARTTYGCGGRAPAPAATAAASFYGGGLTGPVAWREAASAARALGAELAGPAGLGIRVDIPGSAAALVQVALDAGLRLTDPGLLVLSSG